MTENTELQQSKNRISSRRFLSLRLKFILSAVSIAFLSVLGVGYYTISNAQSSNTFLTNQFERNSSQQIENELMATVSLEANRVAVFFQNISNSVQLVSATTEDLLLQQPNQDSENGWNAENVLFQIENGNWDNPNTEPASIFVPAQEELSESILAEIDTLKSLDYFLPNFIQNNPDMLAIYYGSRQGTTIYYPNIDLSALVPPDFDVTGRPWYLAAVNSQKSGNNIAWSDPYQDAALNGLVITTSSPVHDRTGELLGVIGADIQLITITENIASISVGENGYAFMIDPNGRIIAMSNKGYDDFNITEEQFQAGEIEVLSLLNRTQWDIFEVVNKMMGGESQVRRIDLNGTIRYIAYTPIPVVGYSLGIIVPENDVQQVFLESIQRIREEQRTALANTVGVSSAVFALAIVLAYLAGNSVTSPIRKLTSAAEQLAEGNLNTTAEVASRDEIGVLASTFNNMGTRLRELVTNLEGQVAQRTQQLEQRARLIQSAAEVGNAIASARNIENLLQRATQLISEKFGFYHVGIFLLDERGEFAVLQAANSPGGARMLARGHKLRVGEMGIVGAVTSTGTARIALDVGQDAVYFDNPDLPETRSEMALPLIAGPEILGALDVQSTEPNAFSQEDVSTLQILADQVATAVQNARLYSQTQAALDATRRAYGEQIRKSWQALLEERQLGYISRSQGDVLQAKSELPQGVQEALQSGQATIDVDGRVLYVPVQVRGKLIGAIRLAKPKDAPGWVQSEIEDVNRLAGQLSNTFESARIYRETQNRAALEQAIGEISTKIGATTKFETILRTTVAELGQQLGDTEVILELESDQDLEEQAREL
ncbi:MAG: hypothetical protein Kow002_14010 [Anaerolineales bacterium]